MKIDDVRPDSAQETGNRPVRDSGGSDAGAAPVPGPTSPHRTDLFEISAEGHTLARTGGPDAAGDIEDLDPARIDDIRDRIASGVYDAPAMIDELARRLLDSGDL